VCYGRPGLTSGSTVPGHERQFARRVRSWTRPLPHIPPSRSAHPDPGSSSGHRRRDLFPARWVVSTRPPRRDGLFLDLRHPSDLWVGLTPGALLVHPEGRGARRRRSTAAREETPAREQPVRHVVHEDARGVCRVGSKSQSCPSEAERGAGRAGVRRRATYCLGDEGGAGRAERLAKLWTGGRLPLAARPTPRPGSYGAGRRRRFGYYAAANGLYTALHEWTETSGEWRVSTGTGGRSPAEEDARTPLCIRRKPGAPGGRGPLRPGASRHAVPHARARS